MPKSGPKRTQQYSEEFKATAVELTDQYSRLLEAIFPVVPNTKHIDFRFVHEIASEMTADHQICNYFRI